MIDRYDAVAAMREFPLEKKRQALIDAYNKATWHTIKGEVLTQLINDTDPKSREIVRNAIADKDAQVHKHVMNNTSSVPQDMFDDYVKLLQSPSYDVVAGMLEKLSTQFPAKAQQFLDATNGVMGTSGLNVEIKRLEIKARVMNDQASKDKLVAYTSLSYEFRTRVGAALAVQRLNYFSEPLMTHLTGAMVSSNTRLAMPCGAVLKHFYEQAPYRSQIADFIRARKFEAEDSETVWKMLK